MITFTITADGTSDPKYYDQGNNRGSKRTTARARTSAADHDWDSAVITITATPIGSLTGATPIAGLADMTADVDVIPVDIPRGAALRAVCASKVGVVPIYVEID